MDNNPSPNLALPRHTTPDAATSSQTTTRHDQQRLSSLSEMDLLQSDEFLATSHRLTHDYVASNISVPSKTLANADARSQFVSAVLGDVSLGKFAENDRPLLRQLELRLTIIIDRATPMIQSTPNHIDVDTLTAVFVLIAARWPILVETMESQGVILTVITAMQTWSHRPALVARCMTALRVFSVNDAARKRVMIDGGLSLTLDLMKQYSADPRIQMRAAAVIANLAFGCTHRKRRIVREGGVKQVLDGMKQFPDNEQIQLRGALTIRNLTHQTQVNQFIAGNEGAVEIVSYSLLRFRNGNINPELRFHCVMALESLCKEDESNRRRVADLDSREATMTKSLSWGSSVAFPKRALTGVDRLNEDGDIIVEEEEVLLSDVTTKFKHGEALLPGQPSRRLDPPLRTRSVVSRTEMKARSKEMNIRSFPERSKEEKRKPSLIKVIVHAIRRDPDDELLVGAALSLLSLISVQRKNIQLRIGEVGGIQIAIAAMRRHPRHSGIISKASALLRGLCSLDINRGQVTSGLVVMITSIHEHKSDGETVRETMSALSNIVYEHEKNRSSTINKGGVEAIVQAMGNAGKKDTMVLEAGVCALRNLVANSESGALCAVNDGAVQAILDALEKTKDEKSVTQRFVQEQCLLFLIDLATLAPRTKHDMLEVKTIESVEEILGRATIKERDPLYMRAEEILSFLIKLKRSRGSRSSRPSTPPSPTTVASGKTFSRGLFGKIGLNLRAFPAQQGGKMNRLSGVTAGSVESGYGTEKRVFRISGKLLRKSSVVT